MTEAEWLVSADPQAMLRWLADTTHGPCLRATDRKLRLFACACCRQVWPALTDERSRRAVLVAERFVDGAATQEERAAAWSAAWAAAWAAARDAVGSAAWAAVGSAAWAAAGAAARDAVGSAAWDAAWDAAWSAAWAAAGAAAGAAARKTQAALLRCLFGNPWRPADCGWDSGEVWRGDWLITGQVLNLARTIYADRDFAALGILADALEEAGCQDAAVLGHCRGPGPHARGCHALDLVLGKE